MDVTVSGIQKELPNMLIQEHTYAWICDSNTYQVHHLHCTLQPALNN